MKLVRIICLALLFLVLNIAFSFAFSNDLKVLSKKVNTGKSTYKKLKSFKIDDERPLIEPKIIESFFPSLNENKDKKRFLSLKECLSYAYLNTPEIAIKRAELVQKEAKLQQVYALYDPTVSINLNRNVQKVPPQPYNSIEANIGLNHTIYDWNQRKEQLKSARKYVEAARIQVISAWIDKAKDVSLAYLDVIFREWLVVIQRDDLDKAKENLRVAKGFYNAGAKSRIDVTQAQIEISQSEVELAQANNDLRDSKIRLAATMGIKINEIKDKYFIDLFKIQMQTPKKKDAFKIMLKSHPTIIAYKASIKGSQSFAKALESQKRPTLKGEASYGAMGEGLLKYETWNIGVSLSIPIFRDKTIFSKVHEQRAITTQVQKEMERQIIQLTSLINTSYSDISGAIIRQKRAKNGVGQAVHNYILAYKRYKMGVSTIIELNNARDYLNQSRKSYLKSMYDRRASEVRLQNSIGNPPVPKN